MGGVCRIFGDQSSDCGFWRTDDLRLPASISGFQCFFVRCPERETSRVPLRSSHWVQQHFYDIKWPESSGSHTMEPRKCQIPRLSSKTKNTTEVFTSSLGIESTRDAYEKRRTTTSLRPLASLGCRNSLLMEVWGQSIQAFSQDSIFQRSRCFNVNCDPAYSLLGQGPNNGCSMFGASIIHFDWFSLARYLSVTGVPGNWNPKGGIILSHHPHRAATRSMARLVIKPENRNTIILNRDAFPGPMAPKGNPPLTCSGKKSATLKWQLLLWPQTDVELGGPATRPRQISGWLRPRHTETQAPWIRNSIASMGWGKMCGICF